MPFLEILDYIGVFAFAVSGGLVAIRHKMDIFGVLVICLLPAIGGGTMRDLLLDTPVFWLDHPSIVLTAFLGGISAIIYKFWTKTRLLVWVDAMGLALFTVVGCLKAFELGHGFLTCIMMGVLTATAGGLLRDVVAGEPPLLLKKDIYATASIIGATCFLLLLKFGIATNSALLIAGVIIFAVRAYAILKKISLPTLDSVFSKNNLL